jgi:cobalt-zinc-cadmium efflux system membrane fusion protein
MAGIWYRVKRGARGLGLGALLVIAGGSAAFLAARSPQQADPRANQQSDADTADKIRRTGSDEIIVPPSVAQKMGLQVIEVAERVRPLQISPLQGVLAVDTEHLPRVRSRFAGEVVSIGPEKPVNASAGLLAPAPRVGDTVRKGDLLAVVLSKDLGEKKSELVDLLSKLRTDNAILLRLRDGQADGSIPARSVWDAERTVEADQVGVARVERTLRAWRLTDDEIAEVRKEADRIVMPDAKPDARRVDMNRWARVEIRAPENGVILEKNISIGDIVDTSADLFKISDLSRLVVWAHLYEEDLPLVQSLPRPIRWTIALPANPGLTRPGFLDQILPVIDPNQHTALVTGRVENPNGQLKVGQFVTAAIETAAPSGEVEVPIDAVVDDGSQSIVFVQSNSTDRYVRTQVQVTRRFRDTVCIRTSDRLKVGDRIIAKGALLLREAADALPSPRP